MLAQTIHVPQERHDGLGVRETQGGAQRMLIDRIGDDFSDGVL
jgi:hypothetical protein